MVDRNKLMGLIAQAIEQPKVSPGMDLDTLSANVATLRHCWDWAKNADGDAELEEIVSHLEAHPSLKGHPWNEARISQTNS